MKAQLALSWVAALALCSAAVLVFHGEVNSTWNAVLLLAGGLLHIINVTILSTQNVSGSGELYSDAGTE